MELGKSGSITRRGDPASFASAGLSGAWRLPGGSRLLWYWNRLRRMSVAEVGYRVVQKAGAKAEQCGLAAARGVPAPRLARAEPYVRLDAEIRPEPYIAAAERLLDGRLWVLDREYVFTDVPEWNRDPKTGTTAPLVFGRSLDYRNAELVGDIKFLWEINRHVELVVLAQAYRLTGDRIYLAGLERLLESWLEQCPYPLGPNWTSSLELAIRLINWSVIWQLIGGAESAMFRWNENRLRERWLDAVYLHMRFIRGNFSRFSSANNHLIGEAAGLYVATLTWPYWSTCARWRRCARRELLREVFRQNAGDGVNLEQTTGYQQFVLDLLLLSGLAGRANGDDFPVGYWRRLERMLEFIAGIMDVGGNVPMIGDADDGQVVRLGREQEFSQYRSLLSSGAVLYGRGDFKAKARVFDDKSAWLLGAGARQKFDGLPVASPGSFRRAFPEGGYYVLGRDLETPREIRIIADAGPLGYRSIAAHGHADALSFTLAIAGTEMLIDPGTYAYHTERRWRDYFRGTAAHNTVGIDGQNQSVIGGAFMWMQHAGVHVNSWRCGADADYLSARHDGYRRLADPVQHTRELRFDKATAVLQVADTIECAGAHRVQCFWHFAEGVSVALDGAGTIRAEKENQVLRLVPHYPPGVSAALYCGDDTRPSGWVSRRFGVKCPTTTVVWSCEVQRTTRLETRVECFVAPAPMAAGGERD